MFAVCCVWLFDVWWLLCVGRGYSLVVRWLLLGVCCVGCVLLPGVFVYWLFVACVLLCGVCCFMCGVGCVVFAVRSVCLAVVCRVRFGACWLVFDVWCMLCVAVHLNCCVMCGVCR